jgi:tripartite-type tricarboxylate transporter receptor subunit TctC
MHFKSTRRAFTSLAAGTLMALATAPAALAQDDPASFYAGKTVTIYVGFSPGGGYDSYARLAADFLGDHIPGNPTVIVENMTGGGGRVAAQFMYAAAPQDGTALSMIYQSYATDSAAGTIPGGIDATLYSVIGSMAQAYNLGVTWNTSGIETWDDTLNKEVIFGATGAGSTSAIIPRMLSDLEGAQYNIIQGYSGGSAVRLAMESGEVAGMMPSYSSLLSSHPEWFTDGIVNVIWQLSNEPHPDFPDIVAIGKLGDTPEEQAMYRLIAGVAEIGRAIVTTPNVPKERVEALRAAFDAMVQDEAFLAAAKERSLPIKPTGGADLQGKIEAQLDVPEGAIELLKTYLVAQ